MTRTTRKTTRAKPLVLTERDAKIFATIGSYRAMSSEQIQVLYFTSLARARRRIRALWQAGLLKRSQRPVRYGKGSSKFFYSLTSKALNELKQTSSQPIAFKAVRNHEISQHSEKINDFRVCLEFADRSHDPEITLWKEGRELKMQTHAELRGAKRQISLVPDALFTLKLNGKEYSHFLEMDRGTTDLSRLIQKLQGYANLFHDRVPQSTFDIRSFRVLIVTTSRMRIENLAKKLFKINHKIARLDLFCLTDMNSLSLNSPRRLFEPVWFVVDAKGRLISSRPLPTLPPSTFPLMSGKPPVH